MDKFFSKALAVIVSIVIARILDPSDFGLIGMIAIFMAISQLLIDSGFSQALVHKHTPTQRDYSTAFFFNVVVGVACYGLMFLAAPLVANFFGEPILVPLLRVMGISLIASSLTVVHRAKLMIKIDFRKIAIINISSMVLSSILGLWAAYSGYGVWALVIQQVPAQMFNVLLYWLLGRWCPSFTFSAASFRFLFSFGSRLLAAGFVGTIVNNTYNVVIGKLYRDRELGFYTKGRSLSETIAFTVNDVINTVTFPLLSAMKEDRERLVEIYSRMLSMTAFIIIPAMTLSAILTQPFVEEFLTDKWLPAVPIIQWLCMARMFTPISALNMSILNAVGRSDLFMKVDLLKLPLTLGAMAITLPISIDAVVIGNFIVTFVCYFINAYLPGKMFGFGIVAQTKIFAKTILSTLIMTVVLVLVCSFIDNNIVKLVVGMVVALFSFVGAAWVLKIAELREVLLIIKKVVKR